MSYAIEVKVCRDSKFYPNAIRLATSIEAEAYGRNKLATWILAEEFRVVESGEAVNYRWDAEVGLVAAEAAGAVNHGIYSPFSRLLWGELNHQRRQRIRQQAQVAWAREVYAELREGSCQYGSEDWQMRAYLDAGRDVKRRWELTDYDRR